MTLVGVRRHPCSDLSSRRWLARFPGGRPVIGGSALVREPLGDVSGIEPEKMPPFDEWNASLSYEPADVAHRDAELSGDVGDGHEDG